MRYKYLIIGLIILMSVSMVNAFDWDAYNAAKSGTKTSAGLLDKEVATISNCYEINANIEQTAGNDSVGGIK